MQECRATVAVNTLQAGVKAALAKLKLDCPLNTMEQMPKPFHITFTQESYWTFLQFL